MSALLKRRLRDQHWHFLWALANGIFLFASLHTLALGLLSTAWLVGREIMQFPSENTSTNRFWAAVGGWDPWLDLSFYVLGYAIGVPLGLWIR